MLHTQQHHHIIANNFLFIILYKRNQNKKWKMFVCVAFYKMGTKFEILFTIIITNTIKKKTWNDSLVLQFVVTD